MSTEAAKLFWVSDFFIRKRQLAHVESGIPINLCDHLATLRSTKDARRVRGVNKRKEIVDTDRINVK